MSTLPPIPARKSSCKYNPFWLMWRALGRPNYKGHMPQAGAFILWMHENSQAYSLEHPDKFNSDYIYDLDHWAAFIREQYIKQRGRKPNMKSEDSQPKFTVEKSDYLKSRRYNHVLYDRLIVELRETIAEVLDRVDLPGLKIEVSISAKHQTPYVSAEFDGEFPEMGNESDIISQAINDAIDGLDVGYIPDETYEVSHGELTIGFNDGA